MKALSPMYSRLAGSFILSTLLSANASVGITVILSDDITTSLKSLQPKYLLLVDYQYYTL